MTITCPHCESRYVLPLSLMGPGGARVRCPRCHHAFLVTASGEVTALPDVASERSHTQFGDIRLPGRSAPPAASAPVPAAAPDTPRHSANGQESDAGAAHPTPALVPAEGSDAPAEVARRLLAEMDAELGPSKVAAAAGEGTILFNHGLRLMAAWDEYRRILGRGASAAVFREAVRARWGVDLTPVEPLPR